MPADLTRREFLHATGGLAWRPQPGPQPTETAGIVPAPRYLRPSGLVSGVLGPETPVWIGESLRASEHSWAPRPLLRKLREKPPIQPAVLSGADAQLPSPCVLIGSARDHRLLAALSERLSPKLGLPSGQGLGEGYLLETGQHGIRLVAETPAGVFYGAQTALQLLSGEGALAAAEVADAPLAGFRGVHARVTDPAGLPPLHRFVREVMPRHKANVLLAEVNYHFRFRSHPEIAEQTMLSEADARELARLCRENNVRLIPLLNCFSHQSWRDSVHGLLRAYPQFNETPCKTGVLFYAWCASDPRIAPIVCELIDELTTAFETQAVHLGMDEVIEIAQCPFCRRKSPAELFAKVVNEFHAHVVGRRGLEMLIWGDRLIDGRKTPYNPMNGSRNGTHPALHMIPKDILLCDWHYHLHDSYPSVQMFAEAGFDFVACGWQNPQAIRAFQAYARRHGGRRYRGYLATNWSPFVRIARYLTEGVLEESVAAEVRNFALCFQLGMELAWAGAARQ